MFTINPVNILSEKMIKAYWLDSTVNPLLVPVVRIAITDYEPADHVIVSHPYIKETLYLEFCDVTDTEVNTLAAFSRFRDALLTEKQADQIIAFLVQYSRYPLVVNCYAGVSRSAAVGKIACRIKGIDDSWIKPPHFNPNPYIDHLLNTRYSQWLHDHDDQPICP